MNYKKNFFKTITGIFVSCFIWATPGKAFITQDDVKSFTEFFILEIFSNDDSKFLSSIIEQLEVGEVPVDALRLVWERSEGVDSIFSLSVKKTSVQQQFPSVGDILDLLEQNKSLRQFLAHLLLESWNEELRLEEMEYWLYLALSLAQDVMYPSLEVSLNLLDENKDLRRFIAHFLLEFWDEILSLEDVEYWLYLASSLVQNGIYPSEEVFKVMEGTYTFLQSPHQENQCILDILSDYSFDQILSPESSYVLLAALSVQKIPLAWVPQIIDLLKNSNNVVRESTEAILESIRLYDFPYVWAIQLLDALSSNSNQEISSLIPALIYMMTLVNETTDDHTVLPATMNILNAILVMDEKLIIKNYANFNGLFLWVLTNENQGLFEEIKNNSSLELIQILLFNYETRKITVSTFSKIIKGEISFERPWEFLSKILFCNVNPQEIPLYYNEFVQWLFTREEMHGRLTAIFNSFAKNKIPFQSFLTSLLKTPAVSIINAGKGSITNDNVFIPLSAEVLRLLLEKDLLSISSLNGFLELDLQGFCDKLIWFPVSQNNALNSSFTSIVDCCFCTQGMNAINIYKEIFEGIPVEEVSNHLIQNLLSEYKEQVDQNLINQIKILMGRTDGERSRTIIQLHRLLERGIPFNTFKNNIQSFIRNPLRPVQPPIIKTVYHKH